VTDADDATLPPAPDRDAPGPNHDAPRSRPLIAWGQLVRLPNVFTVLADVAAAFLIVSQGPQPIGRFVAILIAGVLLYWAGMILNDVFDVDVDRRQRSARPLAAGRISVGLAKSVGYAMLVGGVVVAAIAGHLPSPDVPATWLPAVVAVLLAVAVVVYDGPLKQTPLGPLVMGVCRVLSFLLGASVHFDLTVGFPNWLTAFGLGMGVYVMGVTLIGRREAIGDRAPHLLTGTIVTALGGVIVATAPRLDLAAKAWHFSPGPPFGLLVAMIVMPIVVRGFRASREGTPESIQSAVRSGVLTIIPLAAAIAFLGAGAFWGLLVFAGVVPSLALSRRFRVT